MAGPKAVRIELSDGERAELEARLRRRKVARGDALRAEIVLLAAEGLSNLAITERLGIARMTVATWRRRFAERRLDGLTDEPRPGAPRTVTDEKVAEVVTATLETLPAGRTHWSSRGMARAAGLAPSTVQRIWKAFSLQPHRTENFKLSTDPLFVEKVRDIVGLYLSPPERAVVLCVDEKSQIQALDRTQPLLPLRPGQVERRTHDYKRCGTTSLFAALDVKAGTVIGKCMPRHRAAEFRRFLDTVEANTPEDLDVHVVMDNASSHKTTLIRNWFAKRPRWHAHYTPTSASWINQVERFFALLTDDAIRRSAHRSTEELETAITAYIDANNAEPKPFRWTKSADDILAAVQRFCRRTTDVQANCLGTSKSGHEDITETLEVVPRSWKVVQTVRERFSCRACETITQPPAPFHPIARGRAGPNLLAMVLEAKYGQHLPLNRQSETFAREGVELSVSTLADWVGTAAAVLSPLHALIRAHVLAAERLHGDDTTVPLLARGKTVTARLWTYVRDDRPFAGPAPPAALFHFSRDRTAEHPRRHLASYSGILQADAYAGFGELYRPDRKPGPITEAACWAHFRRKAFELAEVARAPLAAEAVRRIDRVFEAEREVNGRSAAERLAHRTVVVAPLVADLHAWMLETRARLSRHNDLAKALDYALKRWEAFTGFLADGRVCLTNNAAERALRGVALGRKAWLFAGSDRGGERAAAMYSLITTAKLNDADPRAWLADVLARIADHPASRLDELLPWNWAREMERRKMAA